jgi:hypothetical protein
MPKHPFIKTYPMAVIIYITLALCTVGWMGYKANLTVIMKIKHPPPHGWK